MRIRIADKKVCEQCNRKTCSNNDVVEKTDFYNLKSERYTCPVRLFQYGLTDEQLEQGCIDIDLKENKCIYCLLCAIKCSKQNLQIESYHYDSTNDFELLKSIGELQASAPSNIIALSYLNCLFDFAANTNLNKSLLFDGYVCTVNDEKCFVEVDIQNDSLESCRRLLGDIVSYNAKSQTKINNGLMVLNNFPKEGSRDIYTLIEKIKSFPSTADLHLYITTFSLLRNYVLRFSKNVYSLSDLFLDMASETNEDYKNRLIAKSIIDDVIANQMFA